MQKSRKNGETNPTREKRQWRERFQRLSTYLRTLSRKEDNMTSSNQELVLERTFTAPRDLVFKVWTTPEHLAKWWGPEGFTTTVETLELKAGGNLLLIMHSAEGFAISTKGVFQEVTPPEKLVFTTNSFEDEMGNAQLEVLNTVTLTEVNGKTKLTLHATVLKSTPAVAGSLAGMEMGWNQSLDRLANVLKTA